VLIRQSLRDPTEREILHFDLVVHQALKHPLFDPLNMPLVIIQTYTQLLALNIVTMSITKLLNLFNLNTLSSLPLYQQPT